MIFSNKCDHQTFFNHLNSLHPALEFTTELEENDALPFLDVLVEIDRTKKKSFTSVYRKPTFTGSYVRFESFCHKRRKTSLIRTLLHRAHQICSPEKLEDEVSRIKSIFLDNGYPPYLISKITTSYTQGLSNAVSYGPKKKQVYLKLPYIGKASYRFENMIKSCVDHCFPAVNTNVIFQSRPMFPNMFKERLPTLSSQNMIYLFSCQCNGKYVGKSRRTLGQRVIEHVPKCMTEYIEFVKNGFVGNFESLDQVKKATKASSICEHLYNNRECMLKFNIQQFKPYVHARSEHHLNVLESVCISSINPEICKQMAFVYETLLF